MRIPRKFFYWLPPVVTVLASASLQAATTYQPTWPSVDQHNPAPEWFQDAKFGIYFHWGVFSVPAYYNEWYPREMYEAGTNSNSHHLSTYGDPVTVFPYHFFINGGTNLAGKFVQFAPKLKSAGGNFDPDAWAQLFSDAGAKFAGPVAEHHDGFSMWASTVNEWNSVSKGPNLDLLSLFATAIRAKNLKLLTAMHHAYNFTGYYQYAPAQTDASLKKLYGQLSSTAEYQLWYDKLKEVIDSTQPDIIWQDFNLSAVSQTQRLNFLSYYYNKAIDWNKEVVATYKDGFDTSGEMYDYERGGPAGITNPYWLTDESVSSFTWCYTSGMSLYATQPLLHELIDRVSKNGNLLLNIAPMPDGTIPTNQQNLLLAMGGWLKQNGEAIYSTRAWTNSGEGPTPMGGSLYASPVSGTNTDIRFTRNKTSNVLYAIVLGWPGNGAQLKITTLRSLNIKLDTLTSVQMFGATAGSYINLNRTQDATALNITMPASQPYTAMAYAFKLSFSGTIPVLGYYLPASAALAWKGDGSANAWNTSTSNWLKSGASSKFTNGSDVTFDDSGSNIVAVGLSGILQPASVTLGTARNYSFSGTGSLSGTMPLAVAAGTLTMSNTGTNTFSGGTTISDGGITLGNATANASGLGTGQISMRDNSSLKMYDAGTSTDAGTLANNISVTGTASLELPPRGTFSGDLSGTGTLNLTTHYIRDSITGNWSTFSGVINVSGGSDFRLSNLNGLAKSVVNLGDAIHMYVTSTVSSGGSTLDLGGLSGPATSILQGGPTAGRTLIWRIGGLNQDSAFAGTISENTPGSTLTGITKIGTGTQTLSGTSNYGGPTTVSAGTLLVSGNVTGGNNASVQNTATLNLAAGTLTTGTTTIDAGGTLTGCGTINGALINNGTVLSNCGGKLTVSGTVTNNNTMRLTNGSTLIAGGTFTNYGILDIMTGAQTLPGNFVNHGSVLDSSLVKAKSIAKTGTGLAVSIQTYPGHTYQLQSKALLTDPAWTNVNANVATQTDGAGVMTFTVTGIQANSQFYRIQVGP